MTAYAASALSPPPKTSDWYEQYRWNYAVFEKINALADPNGSLRAFPVGAIFLATVSTSPATLLGYGTWEAIGSGRVLVGVNTGDPDFATGGQTGGAKTHDHDDHAAQAHSGTAVANHASHTHDYTQVPNHVHGMSTVLRTSTTGGATTLVDEVSDTSSTADTTTKTDNPDGGVTSGTTGNESAALTHSVTQPDDHAALDHSAESNLPPYLTCWMWKRTA